MLSAWNEVDTFSAVVINIHSFTKYIYILNLCESGTVLGFVAGGGDNSGKEYRHDPDLGEFAI